MCGIVGILRWNAGLADEAEIERMLRAVAHRGPDGEGRYLRDGVALGHRRLSIIDLEGGRQPMSNEDGSAWITFNGEIYNYRALRSELEGHGHRFATQSDTEVIVHAYEQWGADSVKRLRGMFAFAIADFGRRRMFLARDHFGIKPLYYRLGNDYLAFASELSALRQVNDAAPRGRLQAIEYYLRYRYIPGPETVFEKIWQLPPAHSVEIDFDGHLAEPKCFWEFDFSPPRHKTDGEWQEAFDAALHDSVKSHLVADVPFGVFLSGGIDSTLVAMTMAEILDEPVTAFSIGFDVEAYSELKYATQAAERLGIRLETEIVEPDAAKLVPELLRHYGQPYADTSMIPTWYVSRLARQHVPMVLSGDGGDEAFGGYPWYVENYYSEAFSHVAGLLRSPRGVMWRVPRFFQALTRPAGSRRERYEQLVRCFTAPQRRELWQREHAALCDLDCAGFVAADRKIGRYDGVSYGQMMDQATYLPGDILTKVDVASMCHGLEVRTPLVDVEVWKLVAHMPLDQRARKSPLGTFQQKWLSKKALARKFDASFIHRTKMGFSIPENRWLRPGTPVRTMFDDLLRSSRGRVYQWFSHAAVEQRIGRLDGGGRYEPGLWVILLLALWLEDNQDVSFTAP